MQTKSLLMTAAVSLAVVVAYEKYGTAGKAKIKLGA